MEKDWTKKIIDQTKENNLGDKKEEINKELKKDKKLHRDYLYKSEENDIDEY